MSVKTVILADGNFPVHEIPLGFLRDADIIICCDGSVENLVNAGMTPEAIIGDMDSISQFLRKRYADRIFIDDDQQSNDLTKAVQWCHESGYNDIVIVGATGKREDHTLGNISLLAEYSKYVNVRMVTDTGIIIPFHESCKVQSYNGQQVSLFSIDPETQITSKGLKYPLINRKLGNWWEATLNEATGDNFRLEFSSGSLLVYLKF